MIVRISNSAQAASVSASESNATLIRSGIGPRHPFPRDRTVLDLFLEQVTARADHPAVRYQDRTLTYAMLDHESNLAAGLLLAAGDLRGRLIPLLVGDGPDFPVGLLGIIKTGAAFVPVDPTWPVERLRALGRDLDPRVALASPAASGVVEAMGLASRVVYLDSPNGASTTNLNRTVADHDSGQTRTRPEPFDLIYGYYTSGSTGLPKCALNRHRGLVNRLTAMSRLFGHGSTQITLQNSRPTFDSAIWQVLWPLTTGGQVVLPDRDGILDLEQTAYIIGRYTVTMTDFVPSVLAAFVSLLESRAELRDALRSLSRILIGGEPANPPVVRRLHRMLPHVRLTNTYGPTECSIGSIFHDIDPGVNGKIPLGRAIDNTAALVLDDEKRPVQRGQTGEIYLGGECVGAGYLNNPEGRNSQAFVPNPFHEVAGELLYRTGDLAYIDHADLIYFVGRRDDQVKVGGVRIELGEVDAVLGSHPLVGAAASVVLGDAGDVSLVGCVSSRLTDRPPKEVELRDYAAARLPAEMVPHRIVVTDVLPMNRNGKIDRQALVALVNAAQSLGHARGEDEHAPTDPTELVVTAAWCAVLGREYVSVNVPFADYGGTSLTVFRLTIELRARLGGLVRPRDLLASNTVRGQAARIRGDRSDRDMELAQLIRDAAWRPPRIVPAVGRALPSEDRVLLTGATGFIGAHFLAELLTADHSGVVCLVRARSVAGAIERLRAALRHYRLAAADEELTEAINSGRLVVEPGLLESESLGLPSGRYEWLKSTLRCVVHAGAAVNLLADYDMHRSANVGGTRELLRLAAASGGRRLHVLSTLSIFGAAYKTSRIARERELPAADGLADDGYSRSKYVAERLLETGRRYGISSVVYRLGEVWPHRRLGIANPTSFAHAVLYACVRTGCVFETSSTTVITPVDDVARLVIATATDRLSVPDGAIHLLHPATLSLQQMFTILAGNRRLEPVGYGEFRRRVDTLAQLPQPDVRLVRLNLLLPPPDNGADAAPTQFDKLFSSDSANVEVSALMPRAWRTRRRGAVEALAGYLRELSAVPSAALPLPQQTL